VDRPKSEEDDPRWNRSRKVMEKGSKRGINKGESERKRFGKFGVRKLRGKLEEKKEGYGLSWIVTELGGSEKGLGTGRPPMSTWGKRKRERWTTRRPLRTGAQGLVKKRERGVFWKRRGKIGGKKKFEPEWEGEAEGGVGLRAKRKNLPED